MQTTLNLESRRQAGKGVARKLRRRGRVPGVIYGGGQLPALVHMEAQAALHLFRSISVENTILNLSVDDGEPERALVREIQTHPCRPELLHVDFLRIRRGVAIEVQVPVRLAGVPAGVRNEGGLLDQVVHDLPVKCVPSKIPEVIEVDVTELTVGDVIRAGEIEMPDDVESLADPGRTICAVAAPRVADEEDAEEEAEEQEGAEAPDED